MSQWTDRLTDEVLAGNLTTAHRDVLVALRSLIMSGHPTPDQYRIAHRAGRSRRTVQRALKRAAELGLLTAGAEFHGDRGRRSANRYRLQRPSGPVIKLRQPWRTPKRILPFLLPSCTRARRIQSPKRTPAEQIRFALGIA
jgi:hypothetical protein